MMLIDTRAVIHAMIAANKDWYKFIFTCELLIKSKLVKTKDAKIMGIDTVSYTHLRAHET